jgi:ribosome biogenesis GTPase / thiamine phosphate phosphatase
MAATDRPSLRTGGAGSGPLPLRALGWTPARAAAFGPHALAGLLPGRVTSSGGATTAATGDGPVEVVLQRRTQRDLTTDRDLPAIGDWLALQPVSADPPRAALRAVLPREGTITRSRVDGGGAQVLAANVDLAFLVSGLDHDLNLRRLERYLVLAHDGGLTSIVVLNKVDIALDLEAAVSDVHRIAAGTRVVVASARLGTGIEELRELLGPGTTGCLLGSSGVGKSSIANALLGQERQAVQALREDDSKGRHTTTRRQLFEVPGGGLLIDTPGLRTVGITADEDGLTASFADVDGLARECRFTDCRHGNEPGCAVQAAIADGRLGADRLASHRKLEAERRWLRDRDDVRARRETDRRFGRMYREVAADHRRRRGED